MEIKLLKKGIKVEGKYFPCRYSGAECNINGNATIYLKGWEPLPSEAYKVLKVSNNSDPQTDYMERDSIRISPSSPLFGRVEALAGQR